MKNVTVSDISLNLGNKSSLKTMNSHIQPKHQRVPSYFLAMDLRLQYFVRTFLTNFWSPKSFSLFFLQDF